MSTLADLVLPADVEDDTKDIVGGSYILETGVYEYDINMAYMVQAASEAVGVNMIFTNGNQQFKQSFWVKSGKAKGGKTTYTNSKTGKEHPLPGMSNMNAITFLTLGKQLSELDTEEKVVKLYNYEAKEEVNTTVQVLTDLLGKKIVLGIMKNEVDVTQKNDATGEYEPTGKTKFENEVVKVFQAGTNCTIAEVRGQEDAQFISKWNENNKGTVRNKVKSKGLTGTAGAPGIPATKSLF